MIQQIKINPLPRTGITWALNYCCGPGPSFCYFVWKLIDVFVLLHFAYLWSHCIGMGQQSGLPMYVLSPGFSFIFWLLGKVYVKLHEERCQILLEDTHIIRLETSRTDMNSRSHILEFQLLLVGSSFSLLFPALQKWLLPDFLIWPALQTPNPSIIQKGSLIDTTYLASTIVESQIY